MGTGHVQAAEPHSGEKGFLSERVLSKDEPLGMGLFSQRPFYSVFFCSISRLIALCVVVVACWWRPGCGLYLLGGTGLEEELVERALIAVPDSGCRSGRQMQAGRYACDVSHLSF